MIFVTVGSIFFDELVREVNLAIGEGRITSEVIMQIGYGGSYEPIHCEYFRSSPGLDPYYKRADLLSFA
jgi:UDP-N-acetylglucosamine transferase subunit ALG13